MAHGFSSYFMFSRGRAAPDGVFCLIYTYIRKNWRLSIYHPAPALGDSREFHRSSSVRKEHEIYVVDLQGSHCWLDHCKLMWRVNRKAAKSGQPSPQLRSCQDCREKRQSFLRAVMRRNERFQEVSREARNV